MLATGQPRFQNSPNRTQRSEVLDLSDPTGSTKCQDLALYPTKLSSAAGGLLEGIHPVICGGVIGFFNTANRYKTSINVSDCEIMDCFCRCYDMSGPEAKLLPGTMPMGIDSVNGILSGNGKKLYIVSGQPNDGKDLPLYTQVQS